MMQEVYTDLENKKSIISDLVKALKEDPDYRTAWEANIAMAFQDEMSRYSDKVVPTHVKRLAHQISNRAAANFLNLLIM